MNAMLDETRSYHDPNRRLEEAIRAYLECRERGEEPQLPEGLLHDPEALAALNELIEDERELEPWFGPLRAVTQTESLTRLRLRPTRCRWLRSCLRRGMLKASPD